MPWNKSKHAIEVVRAEHAKWKIAYEKHKAEIAADAKPEKSIFEITNERNDAWRANQ